MRCIQCLSLLLILLSGCSAKPEEEMVSDTVYGQVTAIDEYAFTVVRDDNKKEIFVPFDSDVMILDGNDCSSPSDILMNDELMCTYTNGELTVIEIIHPETPPAE